MPPTTTSIPTPLLIHALLSAYCLAACLMEHLTLFTAWTYISNPGSLQAAQHITGMRTMYLYVVPKAVLTALTIYLALGPGGSDLWWSVGVLAISWGSSFAVQVPLQLKVRRDADREALGRLVRTTWVRTAAMVGHCAVVGGLLFGTSIETS